MKKTLEIIGKAFTALQYVEICLKYNILIYEAFEWPKNHGKGEL